MLVAGGSATASADVYDSAAGTGGHKPDDGHALGDGELLLLDGRVLVAGGGRLTAELYNATNNTWSATASMSESRNDAASFRLSDGRVVVTGGCSNNPNCARAEIYDPASGTWSPTAQMNVLRTRHTATALLDGRFLVAGGGTATAEIYDPASGTWTPTGSMAASRTSHTATRLLNGQVLVTGGCSEKPCRAAEVYNPATGLWTRVHDMNTPRVRHAATLLADGRVLVEGGTYFCDPEFGFCFTTNKARSQRRNQYVTNTGRLIVPRQRTRRSAS